MISDYKEIIENPTNGFEVYAAGKIKQMELKIQLLESKITLESLSDLELQASIVALVVSTSNNDSTKDLLLLELKTRLHRVAMAKFRGDMKKC